MAENFRCAFDKLNGESVMGIYGSAHIGLDKMDFTNTVPSMANQIREFYGEALHSEDLRNMEQFNARISDLMRAICGRVCRRQLKLQLIKLWHCVRGKYRL
jgi:hypothetical protein